MESRDYKAGRESRTVDSNKESLACRHQEPAPWRAQSTGSLFAKNQGSKGSQG